MIAVCLKWVDQRPEVDAAGHPDPDARFAGVSPADQAALEWALRCRDTWGGHEVVALTVGPPAAAAVLSDAHAAGADRAVRINAPFGALSRVVARLLAAQLGDASFVFCGDYSFDRGTGSVPAFVAGELGIAQALGLVELRLGSGRSAGIEALRRVDGGRRDRLAVVEPAVLSVEGSTALLRRAPLRSMLAHATVELVNPSALPAHPAPEVSRPFRPRPRVLAAPASAVALDRVKSLTAVGAIMARGDPVTLDPEAAADRILEALRDWEYLAR